MTVTNCSLLSEVIVSCSKVPQQDSLSGILSESINLESCMSELPEKVKQAMQETFGEDQRRIDHACEVAFWATNLLAYIDADTELTLCAAYLHDIGIHEAERKYGANSGTYQELEGPPIARAILEGLGVEELKIVTICDMVGRHHTPKGIDSAEFRILWDADALVNLAEVLPGKSEDAAGRIIHKSMVTEPGYRLALKKFLSKDSLPPHL